MTLETEFHLTLENRCAEWAELDGGKPQRNYMLPNGKIADIIYVAHGGAITIIEVKTTLKDYLLRSAHKKYGSYCTLLWVAAPLSEAMSTIGFNCMSDMPNLTAKIGILGVTDRSVTKLRIARPHHIMDHTNRYLRWALRERHNAQIIPVQKQPNT